MIVKFSEVGLNEHFTFANDNTGWIGDCIKISPQRYAICTTRHPIIVRTRYTTRLCKVDNTCACTEPRPLTFNDLSIGSIFQFGFVYRLWEKQTVLYIKLDNVHYRRLSASIPAHIADVNCTVCTVYNMQVAQ